MGAKTRQEPAQGNHFHIFCTQGKHSISQLHSEIGSSVVTKDELTVPVPEYLIPGSTTDAPPLEESRRYNGSTATTTTTNCYWLVSSWTT